MWSGNIALLPQPPMNIKTEPRISAPEIFTFQNPSDTVPLAICGFIEFNVPKSNVPATMHTMTIPRRKKLSAKRVTIKAILDAATALGRSYQKPIRR